MNGNKKGSAFERSICKQLSLWWTQDNDPPSDDVYWRSSQSGGRATIRARKGKTTAGSYGDIVALDPIGEPLLKLFTLELKRGRSHGDPGDLLDCSADLNCHKWMQTMRQARDAHDAASSYTWMVIAQRDRRKCCVFFPAFLLKEGEPLGKLMKKLIRPPIFRYRIEEFDFVGMTLEKFLESTHPDMLRAFVR